MSTVLPEKILRLLSPEDRASLGKAGLTAEEALAKADVKNERDLHRQIRALLGLKGIEFIESRMDKKTTQKKGVPDFIFCVFQSQFDSIQSPRGPSEPPMWKLYHPAQAWECKFKNGSLSIEQQQMFLRLSKPPNLWKCTVIRSVDQALAELKEMGIQ